MGSNVCAISGESGFRCNFRIGNFSAGNLTRTTNGTLNNLEQLDSIKPDADVAGIGILVTFAFAYFLSTLVALFIHALECFEIFGYTRGNSVQWAHRTMNKALVMLSDQQIVLSMATSLAALKLWCEFSTYHLNLIHQWLIFCTITHTNALLVHCDYFNPKKAPATILRMILILVHIALAGVVLFANGQDMGTWSPTIGDMTPLQMLPAQCFFQNATMPSSLKTAELGWNGTGITGRWLFFASVALIVCGMVSFIIDGIGKLAKQDFRKNLPSWIIRTGLLIINLVIGVIVMRATVDLRRWMIDNEWVEDGSENKLSYGQCVPIFLSLFLVISVFETLFDELPDDDNGDGDNKSDL